MKKNWQKKQYRYLNAKRIYQETSAEYKRVTHTYDADQMRKSSMFRFKTDVKRLNRSSTKTNFIFVAMNFRQLLEYMQFNERDILDIHSVRRLQRYRRLSSRRIWSLTNNNKPTNYKS